jgi:hypothetical protein
MPGPTIRIPLNLSDSPATRKLRKVLRERSVIPSSVQSLVAEGIMIRLIVLSKTQAVRSKINGISLEDMGEMLGAMEAAESAHEAGLISEVNGGIKITSLESSPIQDDTPNESVRAVGKEIFEAWNKLAKEKKLATVLSIDSRLPIIATRMKQRGFVEQWRRAMKIVGKSAFHCGSNDRGWKAKLDWFLTTKAGVPNWMRLIENEGTIPAVVEDEEDNTPLYLRGL